MFGEGGGDEIKTTFATSTFKSPLLTNILSASSCCMPTSSIDVNFCLVCLDLKATRAATLTVGLHGLHSIHHAVCDTSTVTHWTIGLNNNMSKDVLLKDGLFEFLPSWVQDCASNFSTTVRLLRQQL